MSGATDDELDADSKAIVRAIEEMHELEGRKRQAQRSTPEFHRLADDVLAKAKEAWELAAKAHRDGDDDSPLAEDRENSGPGDWTR